MEHILIVIGFHIILRYNDGKTFGYRMQDMRDPWGENTTDFADYFDATEHAQRLHLTRQFPMLRVWMVPRAGAAPALPA